MDIIPLDMRAIVFVSPYMYMQDTIFMQRDNQYCIIKDGNSFIINTHNDKSKLSLLSATKARKFISYNKEYALLF